MIIYLGQRAQVLAELVGIDRADLAAIAARSITSWNSWASFGSYHFKISAPRSMSSSGTGALGLSLIPTMPLGDFFRGSTGFHAKPIYSEQ